MSIYTWYFCFIHHGKKKQNEAKRKFVLVIACTHGVCLPSLKSAWDLVYLVCPQTYSHAVMCKVCLTASNTVFGADAVVRLNHWILSNFWRVRFWLCRLIKLAEHILLNSPFTYPVFRLTLMGQGNWGWWAASTKIPSVSGASSL